MSRVGSAVRARTGRTLTATHLAVVAMLASGCSVFSGGDGPPDAQADRPLAVLGDQADEFGVALATARWIETRECMAERGFDFPASATEDSPLPEQPLGIDDLDLAREFGYRAPPRPNLPDTLASFRERLDPGEQQAFDEAYIGTAPGEMVEVDLPGGNDTEVGIGQEGTCWVEARTAVEGDAVRYTALRTAIDDIANKAAGDAMNDDRVLAALDEWSACMAAEGFDFKDPLSAAEAQLTTAGDSATPSAVEIAQAVADVECKTSTGLVETFRTVRNGYEQRAVDENVELLAEWQDTVDAVLDRATAIVEQQPG